MADELHPIETAPLDGRWLLVLDQSRKYPQTFHGPWVIATRCDGADGWHDDDGNGVSPTHWVELPDPQPEPSKWAPPEGRICIDEITGDGWTDGKGTPVTVPWRWMVYVERSDGSYDEYRDTEHAVTLDDAQQRAQRLSAKIGLIEIVVRPLANKVVRLPSHESIQ